MSDTKAGVVSQQQELGLGVDLPADLKQRNRRLLSEFAAIIIAVKTVLVNLERAAASFANSVLVDSVSELSRQAKERRLALIELDPRTWSQRRNRGWDE